MTTCKDCLHSEVCAYIKPDLPICSDFADRSRYVVRESARMAPAAIERRTIMICDDCLLKDYCYWNGKVNFIGCEMKRTNNIDTCVAYGAPVPEGTQVCGKCGGRNE